MNNRLLATIKSTSTTKDGPGTFESVLSMPTVDRDMEVVDSGAFNPLPDHITIDIDHAMSVEKTIGSGTPYYDGDLLKFKGTFASTPLAQMVRTLVDEGHIRTMSVAYHNGTARYEVDEKDGLNHLRSGELLNAGIVGIPSNREALIIASKSFIADVLEATVVDEPVSKSGARHSTKDLQLMQAAHDALIALGAACATKTLEASNDSTNTDEKAAPAADVKSPAVPAVSNVGVILARVQLALADAELAI